MRATKFDEWERQAVSYFNNDASEPPEPLKTHETLALLRACKRAYAIEFSVTQGTERKLREGYLDLLEEALPTDEQRAKGGGTVSEPKHDLYTKGDCQVFHSEDRQCPVCEGGLAVCKTCGEYEAGLDSPCRPSRASNKQPTTS